MSLSIVKVHGFHFHCHSVRRRRDTHTHSLLQAARTTPATLTHTLTSTTRRTRRRCPAHCSRSRRSCRVRAAQDVTGYCQTRTNVSGLCASGTFPSTRSWSGRRTGATAAAYQVRPGRTAAVGTVSRTRTATCS